MPGMADPANFLHLARPLHAAPVGGQPTTTPINILIHPQALFSVLDHTLRRPQNQERVIGTLLGTRNEDGTEVQITTAYAVPHTETAEQVEVDMDYQKTMLQLHLRSQPREVLVGWYATSNELNTFSALIQNFYGQSGDGTAPWPAVHLTVASEPGQGIDVRTYVSAPIGVTAERAADSCLFVPVPHEIKYGESERSALELIGGAKEREDRQTGVITDIESLERNIEYVLEMLDRVSDYVSSVLDEEEEPSTALGQFLLNALSLAPKVDIADVERDLCVLPWLFMREPMLTCLSATTTSRTCCSCHTSPTRYGRRSTSPTVSQRRRSQWADQAKAPKTAARAATRKTGKIKSRAAVDQEGTGNSRGSPRSPTHEGTDDSIRGKRIRKSCQHGVWRLSSVQCICLAAWKVRVSAQSVTEEMRRTSLLERELSPVLRASRHRVEIDVEDAFERVVKRDTASAAPRTARRGGW